MVASVASSVFALKDVSCWAQFLSLRVENDFIKSEKMVGLLHATRGSAVIVILIKKVHFCGIFLLRMTKKKSAQVHFRVVCSRRVLPSWD